MDGSGEVTITTAPLRERADAHVCMYMCIDGAYDMRWVGCAAETLR